MWGLTPHENECQKTIVRQKWPLLSDNFGDRSQEIGGVKVWEVRKGEKWSRCVECVVESFDKVTVLQ